MQNKWLVSRLHPAKDADHNRQHVIRHFIESADGRMHVLECNPRGTSGIHLFSDQPEALVQALGEPGGEARLWNA